MSSDGMTDRDEAVMSFVDDQIQHVEEGADEPSEEIAELRDLCRDLAARVDRVETEQAQAEQKRRDLRRDITQMQEMIQGDGSGVTGTTELEQYATAPEGMLSDLPTNKRRAIRLYNNWLSIAWRPDANEENKNKWMVDTATRKNAKNNPSRLKHELELLEESGLSWNDVYRTMKHMAKMSGGEEHVDDYGRSHIVGGDYEYHEKPTADNSKMKRILKEVQN